MKCFDPLAASSVPLVPSNRGANSLDAAGRDARPPETAAWRYDFSSSPPSWERPGAAVTEGDGSIVTREGVEPGAGRSGEAEHVLVRQAPVRRVGTPRPSRFCSWCGSMCDGRKQGAAGGWKHVDRTQSKFGFVTPCRPVRVRASDPGNVVRGRAEGGLRGKAWTLWVA